MRIAIIGATGMLGHHTAKAVIAAGHELVVVHRAGSKLERIADLEYTSAIGDLDDRGSLTAALADVNAVINCAAYYPTVPRPWREDVRRGVDQMDRFYDACADCQLDKIVYLGGAIALRKNPSGAPGHEDLSYGNAPDDLNPYLQVKWAMDKLAIDKAAEGLPVVIGIPSMTFGEWDYGPTTGRLIVEIANKTLPAYVRGDRNAVYAGDAGRGLLLVCEKGTPGERYLITGHDVSMDALAAKIAAVAQVPTPRAVPLLAARALSKLQAVRYKLGGPEPVVSATAIAVMSAGQFLDGSKARRDLGYTPEVTLDDALARALTWFRYVGYVG